MKGPSSSERAHAYAELRRKRSEEATLISSMLRDRVDDLAPTLIPEGARQGRDWRAGRNGSRSIILAGPNRGVYRDFKRSDKGMDLLAAVAELLCNGSLKQAVEWSRAYLGLSGIDEGALALAEKKARERAAQDKSDQAAQDLKRRDQAGGIWHSAGPLAGSMADDYLRAARGIHLSRLAKVPGALRFSAEVWCKERRGKYPAMVSSLWRPGEPKLVAVHRTYLEQRPDGVVDKAPVKVPRSILGSWPGAVIPIQRGEAGTRWKDIAEGELVAFGEGIEEALSIALVKPAWRVAAVGFVGNFAQLALPVWCHIVLAINNDGEGSEAHRAVFGGRRANGSLASGAVKDLEAKGHVVRVARPPDDYKDWNDFLRGIKRGR